jgi:hypothetical protein
MGHKGDRYPRTYRLTPEGAQAARAVLRQ